MPKAVLSNRIFIDFDPSSGEIERLKDRLTHKLPPTYNNPKVPVLLRTYTLPRNNILTMPIGRTDLIPSNYEIVDKRVEVPASIPAFKMTLRESQQEIVDSIQGNSIISAKVGFGKTFMGCYLLSKFQQKALIIVPTSTLLAQWVVEIEKTLGFTPGVIGGGKFNIEPPVVIGLPISINNRLSNLRRSFGLVLVDEVHRVPATTFSNIIDSMYAKIKIGMSGTLDRKDNRQVLIRDYFGDNILVAKDENRMTPEVHVWKPGIWLQDGIPNWGDKVTDLIENSSYIDFLTDLSKAYAALGHSVLLVGDRVNLLEKLHAKNLKDTVLITGETENREALMELVANGSKPILLGSRAIFSEGVSINRLGVLIIGTPVNNDPLLEQLCGRVTRPMEGKLNPIIAEIELEGNTARKQAMNRGAFYARQGWKASKK